MIDNDLLHAAKIFIIDDEENNTRLLEKMLRLWGYENLTVINDSREAHELFKRHRPDIVFLDWTMPHLDGGEILELLRGEIGENFTPIVVLTADISAHTKRHALAAGAADFLTKPYDSIEVLLRLENLLKMRFLYLELQNKNAQIESFLAQTAA